MSRSKPRSETNTNPASITLEWKGGEGHWRYWNKAEKKQEHVNSVSFVLLDELSSISGFAEQYGTSGFSNEVHSTKTEELVVRVFRDAGAKVVCRGLYSDIKADLPSGLKYTKVLYALDVSSKKIIRLLLSGSALTSWINTEIDRNGVISQERTQDGKKGAVKFKIPVFESSEISQEDDELALEADKELQEYLESRKAPIAETPDEAHNDAAPGPDPDDMPF
jgi:hypothetical protein